MCDHSPNREAAMVTVEPGVWCDPCLAPLVKALNDGGIRTTSSCCGHTDGNGVGAISIADGRWLVIVPDDQAWERALHAARASAHPLDFTGEVP